MNTKIGLRFQRPNKACESIFEGDMVLSQELHHMNQVSKYRILPHKTQIIQYPRIFLRIASIDLGMI
jgi:hypothetical protein